jgi:hypothetical protein
MQYSPTTDRPIGASRPKRAPLAKLGLIGVAGLSLSALTGMGVAEATTTGPNVHEQQNLNQNVAIATGNVHTIVVTSPVLKPGDYLVNLMMDIGNNQPGSDFLCGDATTTSLDAVYGNYGILDNEGTTAPAAGTCEVTSTVTITQANDHVIGWATVYSGPGGAVAGGWSMNETNIGNLTVTH